MSSIVVNQTQTHLNYPPTINGHWLLGAMPEFKKDTLAPLIRYNEQFGNAQRIRFVPGFYGYIFNHPDHFKHILQDNNQNYTKSPHPTFEVFRPLLGNGLLTSDGDFWRRQRRLAQPAFHRRRIADFGTLMTEATAVMLEKWRHQPAGQPIPIEEEMTRLTMEIVGKALFSMDITREAEQVGEAFTQANHDISVLNTTAFNTLLLKIPFLPITRRLNQNIRKLEEVVDHIITQRRNNPPAPDSREAGDLLSMLMEAKDEETGQGMDAKQLRDEVMTLFLAGHETTANTLTWTFYLLYQNPEARAKLEAELRTVLNGRLPTIADLPNLPYTNMVIEESLRLYPVAYAIARWCNQADKVGGYDVPANSPITMTTYVLHRNPDFWPDPEKFEPERFTPERKAERPRYAYVPFGGGPRQCIGNQFALTEAALILATICQNYRLDLVPGHPVVIDPLITLRPKYGLPMNASAIA